MYAKLKYKESKSRWKTPDHYVNKFIFKVPEYAICNIDAFFSSKLIIKEAIMR